MPETPVPTPEAGQTAPSPPAVPQEPVSEALMEDAVRWASDCKLAPPVEVSKPERIDYPVSGHGYSVAIREKGGKSRLATAQFNADGSRSLWTMDSPGLP